MGGVHKHQECTIHLIKFFPLGVMYHWCMARTFLLRKVQVCNGYMYELMTSCMSFLVICRGN